MTGGLLQLKFKSGFSNKLIGNPEISFYKVVYRKHTNFSLESYNIPLIQKLLNEDSKNLTNKIKIPRYGDLLKDVSLKFTLPNIYSGSYNKATPDSVLNNIPYEFRWVENIGTNILTNTKLHINNSVVNEISGELMDVLSEINYDDSKKKLYNEMIGNVPEVYKPFVKNKDNREKFVAILTNQHGSNTISSDTYTTPSALLTNIGDGSIKVFDDSLFSIVKTDDNRIKTIQIEKYGEFLKDHYRSKVFNSTTELGEILILNSNYPHMRGTSTTQNAIYNIFTHNVIAKNSDINTNTRSSMIPSIHKRNCRVPIPFFFSNNPGMALPLIALQYSPVIVELELNSIKNLYTVLTLSDTDATNLVDTPNTLFTNNKGVTDLNRKVYRVRPWDELNINTFLETDTLNLDMVLECTYIFLDNEERKRFALNKLEYLIEEYQHISIKDKVVSNDEFNIKGLNYPVKELIIVSQRSDMASINNWNNYSNWIIDDVAPYSYEYHNYENMYMDDNATGNLKYLYYNKHNNNTNNTNAILDMKYCKQNIIDNITFIFNGRNREAKRDMEYFNIYQPFQYHQRKIKSGIHLYSFSLNPHNYQPSGFCDFSAIENFHINLDLGLNENEKEIPKSNNEYLFKYNFRLYAINYNFLIIESGQGGTQFGN